MGKRHASLRVSEHQEQVNLMEWAGMARTYPELTLLFAIPNGGPRHKAVAVKLKKEGVKSGVPDLMLPVARAGFHGVFIEMKARGGRESINQRTWRKALTQQGYMAVVCLGFDEAREVLKRYLLSQYGGQGIQDVGRTSAPA